MVKITMTDLAGALVTAGFQMREAIMENDQVIFIFDDTDSLEEAKRAFYAGEFPLDAKAYSRTLKDMKAIIWELRNAHTQNSQNS
jgi:uncharacterized protein (DUF1697 family)